MKSITVLVLVLFALPAFADTYKWTDSRGTVNYADDLGKVPPKYRKKAKKLDGDATPVEVIDVQDGSKGKDTGSGQKAQAQTEEKKKEYGGKSEENWKNRFSAINNQIQSVDVQISDRKQRLSDPSKLSRSNYLSIQSELRNFEGQRTDLRQKLNALNAEADRANVPGDLRNAQ